MTNSAITPTEQVPSILHNAAERTVLEWTFTNQTGSRSRVGFHYNFMHSFLKHNREPAVQTPHFSFKALARV
ncbi:hypothetical protein LOK49_LG01G02125 [Camellia lanceoleosa]|uniref:Uncharacterized protein n=1 Tax=Camellia lanceoleosa TaxID=1840588 RepID=A0ACC0IWS3_9ERIC|nr:hypothetical protein LOK49_LG01G02125 [Camellia lanceoleosa]